jgi:hypothetical protein
MADYQIFPRNSEVLVTAIRLIVNYGEPLAPCDCHSCVLVYRSIDPGR